MRRSALLLVLVCAGCGASSRARTDDAPRVMMSERLIACETLVSELRSLDTRRMTEADLVERMREAEASSAVCAELWRGEAETPGEAVIADQEARQVPFHALLLEGVLASRFDGMSNYCTILDDTFAILFEGLGEIEAALAGRALTDDERGRLIELRDLDLEAMDVLLVLRSEHCD